MYIDTKILNLNVFKSSEFSIVYFTSSGGKYRHSRQFNLWSVATYTSFILQSHFSIVFQFLSNISVISNIHISSGDMKFNFIQRRNSSFGSI